MYEIGYNADVSGYEMGEDMWDAGDDVEALLGYSRLPQVQRALARRGGRYPAPTQRVAPGLLAKIPETAREWTIGFSSTSAVTKSGGTAIITQRPQQLFRPERVIVPASINTAAGAPGFLINDIKVGNVSQLLTAGSVPAAMFEQTAFGVRLLMDTCNPAIDLVLSVTNAGATADTTFYASMVGKVLK